MEEYAKQSTHRRIMEGNHRRSSIGCHSDLKIHHHSAPQLYKRSDTNPEEDETDDLSECSTILSSMEMSSSSLASSDKSSRKPAKTKKKSEKVPFELENDDGGSPGEDDSSERAFKDSIFHQYCKSYQSPSPSPNKDSLKQQFRFGWEQAISPAPLSPKQERPNNSTDRRKMFSRWASTGHLCPTDDECDPTDRQIRDKPPTSPVRRTPAAEVASDMPSAPSLRERDSGNSHDTPKTNDTLPVAPRSTNRREYFTRRASTGIMCSGSKSNKKKRKSKGVVKLHQEKETFETPASPHKNDKAPIIPDRRQQFRRRNSTGSADSLEEMLVCLTDDDDEEDKATFAKASKNKSKSSKSKNRRASIAGDYSASSSSSKGEVEKRSSGENVKSSKKKAKKKEKPSKDTKDKSSKKKDKSSSKHSSFSGPCPDKKSMDPRECLKNESLFSLLGKSTSTLLSQTNHFFQAPEADPKPVSRPLRTFSRCASTSILSGDGMARMPSKSKVKMGGTTTPASPFQIKGKVGKLRNIFEQKPI